MSARQKWLLNPINIQQRKQWLIMLMIDWLLKHDCTVIFLDQSTFVQFPNNKYGFVDSIMKNFVWNTCRLQSNIEYLQLWDGNKFRCCRKFLVYGVSVQKSILQKNSLSISIDSYKGSTLLMANRAPSHR